MSASLKSLYLNSEEWVPVVPSTVHEYRDMIFEAWMNGRLAGMGHYDTHRCDFNGVRFGQQD